MQAERKWVVGRRDRDAAAVGEIAKELNIEPLTATLLYGRGCRTAKEAADFLHLEKELLFDPFAMADMEKACARLAEARERGETVTVYGDYDVDGVTSVCLLTLYLKENGFSVHHYIPNRAEEGYGVNAGALERLVREGTGLIVTVDTGVTAVTEAALLKEWGCDLIVTDHHECREELPDALAVVNPRRQGCPYPFKELAGVGVAFKLATALEYTLRKRRGESTGGLLEELCGRYADLVALGTVADVMPLVGENRLLVAMGLKALNRGGRPGLRALLDASSGGKGKGRQEVTSSTVGFLLAPRINAAGRLDSAETSLSLLLSRSEKEATPLAERLCELNRLRQKEENRIAEEIEKTLAENPSEREGAVIVLGEESWHPGVIGIVASRIAERFGKPTLLVCFDGETGKGSGRSVKGLNLAEALAACGDLLLRYGGHEMAAGLTVTRELFPAFKKRINEVARQMLPGGEILSEIEADCELYPEEITLKQAGELSLLEPFGTANPVPVFEVRDLTLREIIPLGSEQRHSKLTLEKDGRRFSAVCFGSSPDRLGYLPGDRLDILCNLSVNEFLGSRSVQLQVRQSRLIGEERQRRRRLLSLYEETKEEGKPLPDGWFPAREDFATVFRYLKRLLPGEGREVCLNRILCGLGGEDGPSELDYVRLRLILDILSESGVISLTERDLSRVGMETFVISVNSIEKKVDLTETCLYKQLKSVETILTQV